MFKNIFNLAQIATKTKFVPFKLFKQSSVINYKLTFAFTSTSNPSQVALM